MFAVATIVAKPGSFESASAASLAAATLVAKSSYAACASASPTTSSKYAPLRVRTFVAREIKLIGPLVVVAPAVVVTAVVVAAGVVAAPNLYPASSSLFIVSPPRSVLSLEAIPAIYPIRAAELISSAAALSTSILSVLLTSFLMSFENSVKTISLDKSGPPPCCPPPVVVRDVRIIAAAASTIPLNIGKAVGWSGFVGWPATITGSVSLIPPAIVVAADHSMEAGFEVMSVLAREVPAAVA